MSQEEFIAQLTEEERVMMQPETLAACEIFGRFGPPEHRQQIESVYSLYALDGMYDFNQTEIPITLHLSVAHPFVPDSADQVVRSEQYDLFLGEKLSGRYIGFEITLLFQSEGIVRAVTRVERNDPGQDKVLPLGVGEDLYMRVFTFFSELAKYRDLSIEHHVEREVGRVIPLPKEKWRRKFEPMLTAENYQRIGTDHWVKTYDDE